MFLLLIAAIFILSVDNTVNSLEEWLNQFNYHTSMGGSDGKFEVYWNSDEVNCKLEIGLAVETDGWLAFGISDSGTGMTDSDIVLGWIAPDHQYMLTNRYGFGYTYPPAFADQSHIRKIDGWKNIVNGTMMTYLRFEKEMFPDFDPRAVAIKIGTSKAIWAYRDGELTATATPPIHASCPPGSTFCTRGMETMNLLQGESSEIPREPDAISLDIFFENVAVPNTDTTYYCSLHKLPELEETHHIVQVDPLIQSDNIGTVHHILLYVCPEHMINMSHIGFGSICDDMNQNMPGVYCRGGIVFFGWAIGGNSFYFPENVGMEMSGPDLDAVQYVLLETHYDNPSLNDNIIDSSGLTLWYTPTVRPKSAGMLMIGMDANPSSLFVPPGIEKATLYGYCFMDCIAAGIEGTDDENNGDDKIYAIANNLHSHLLGRQMALRHIRNGQELKPLDINLAYDFDYQQITPFAEEVEILPGDELIVECVYDSSGTDSMTWGGESTNDEMCFSFLMVYPKPKFAWTEDLGRFWTEANQRGYVQNSSAIYDVTEEGALEFYTEFQEGNIFTNNGDGALRSQVCLDFQHDPIVEGSTINSVLRADVEYSSFNNDDFYICGIDEDDGGFDWNGWYIYIVGSLIGILLIVLAVYVVLKLKNKNKRNSLYHRVLSKEQNNYGTKRSASEQQISMQDRM